MSSQAVDMGVLIDVCRLGLGKKDFVSIGDIVRAYNRRCVRACRVYYLPRSALDLAMLSVPGGCVIRFNASGGYRCSGEVRGIGRCGVGGVGCGV